ncbi:large subunit ribosomal protein L15 [Anaeroplasma bactoclasticum]|jgi:large subunit ribosomal protein L15|uniref:Large ribosomal subunit protein uL15 n=1 Tax=Anaeroplasma bactoclasticum TaxID=2088 RepID=A0A397RWQ1_9MOLU|nr:50S ribosomal protein L15 [Anaeroplasma bactoclasticum]RIA78178.1 large subunit ribosomal protein L15 [Anaeroplasma bactoclasticum]
MLNNLSPVQGARHYKKRLGRGIGSGIGHTSGKGTKGQNARSGGGVRPGFEGGQLPLFQRLPKRGFHNHNKVEYAVVNVEKLNVFEDGAVVDAEALVKAALIKDVKDGVKVLGNGELTKKLTVKANKFSEAAKKAIEAKGGSVEEVK